MREQDVHNGRSGHDMRLKELKIFVEENKDHPKFKSKIGWRATYDGKLYGDQLYTTPPSEAKLVEVINLFLGRLLESSKCLRTSPPQMWLR